MKVKWGEFRWSAMVWWSQSPSFNESDRKVGVTNVQNGIKIGELI